ncbi:Uncharacterized protein TCM_013779 [Theobroma cacao]|uniref:Uncharacterized protein n=1 Tax=Theobroma cacao TaxID=3641 RepID=A0A061G3X2_THECC|nr:Uncharacterized protein TCM_013779 [Theobroma cacao]
MIRGSDAPQFAFVLKERFIYLIDKFQAMKAKNNLNALLGDIMVIFSRLAIVKEVYDHVIRHPFYHSNFIQYSALHDIIHQKKVLTDIIGLLKTMSLVTKVQLNNKDLFVQKQDIHIQNTR